MARPVRDSGSNNQDAAVVDSLIRKLRPIGSFERSTFGSDRPSAMATRSLPSTRPIRSPMRPWAVWACVGLGVLLGVALLQWPYAHACGSWLLLYLIAVSTVVVAGLWGARISWRSRMGLAHVVALATMIWGLALTSQEVLPRVGYAKARLAWRCHDFHATEPSTSVFSTLTQRLADMVR